MPRTPDAATQPMLRFVMCGSVDDGKSTLIGRLLYECDAVASDHLDQVVSDSRRYGTQGSEPDLALLTDGLLAEREQGITIDVAYRFFATPARRFLVADAPGHEQYTRNMVGGASTADLAVIVVDARKGVVTQTRRHSYLLALLGVHKVVLAVNKMDLVGWSEAVVHEIRCAYGEFAAKVGLTDVSVIPVSALLGDNVTTPSGHMAWYAGQTLAAYLESADAIPADATGPFRFPVQWVNRPDSTFRGLSGTVVGGSVEAGDAVRILPSGARATVARVLTAEGDLTRATRGRAVTILLDDAVDAGRGDVLSAEEAPAPVADQFQAQLVWMSERPMLPSRPYAFKLGTHSGTLRIDRPKYRIDIDTLVPTAATMLRLNEIGVCNLVVDRPLAFESYTDNRELGGFIVIDQVTKDTVAAGMLQFALRRSENVTWQTVEVDQRARRALMGHRRAIVWFTGLPGAGKSTIANAVERRLYAEGLHSYLLDGDNIRHGLNRDLGFTEVDRIENVRRIAEVAGLMADAGLIVLVACISPFRDDRRLARSVVGDGEFCEVFVDTPLAVAEARDRKGLYAKARRGELPNFTGIDSPYEMPEYPEVHVDMESWSVEQGADAVVAHLRSMGILG
jgi:bifunctional enzyme CysN/CysC